MPNCSRIEWLNSVKSTNQVAGDRIYGLDNLSVIAAREQTSGRGRGSHLWHSRKDENLTFSLVLKYSADTLNLQASDAILITCMTTMGIVDYLKSKGISPRIKWPNDIWVGDRKICGILIENQLEDSRFIYSIIGVGFNLNQTYWPKELPNPISLKELTDKDFCLEEELSDMIEKICLRYNSLLSAQGRKSLQEEFGKYVFRLDE